MTPTQHQPPPILLPAIERLRRGDLAGARREAAAALAGTPDSLELLEFAGLLAAQTSDFPTAVMHFRRLFGIAPDHPGGRFNLAAALLGSGDLEAAAELGDVADAEPRLLRLLGYVRQQQGRLNEAADAYRRAIQCAADDFESWNNLGNVLGALADVDGAIRALEEAIRLRPDLVQIYLNLSEMLARGDQHGPRQALMREAARLAPTNPVVLTELGLAESAMSEFDAAERAYREALRIDPRLLSAYLELGLLYENLNRIEALVQLVAQAEEQGLGGPEIGFVKAWALRRQGRFAEAEPLADATPPSINPVRRAQLVAEIADRVGDPADAFAAFAAMNAAALASRPAPEGPRYREEVAAEALQLTAESVAAWSKVSVPSQPPAPIFIVGFPRSGTTLLDTLLMNLPQMHVLEELPIMREVGARLGDRARLVRLDESEAADLRAHYFEVLAREAPPGPGQTVVDKFPLHMARMPLIHRIFPDAKVIFCERHPCDAVLSCFMQNFTLNHAMRSFTDLEEAARTYDAVFDHWTRARALFPIEVHAVRYERMVEDLEAEMRPLLAFLDLPWDPKVLDNQGAAARRDHIRTASYAQVTEPIYRRSAGRWQRYRRQMEPVLPHLAPWAERMGYTI